MPPTISASRFTTPPTPTATDAAKNSSPRHSPVAANASFTRRSSATTSRRDAQQRRGQSELPHDFSPAFVRTALEASLRRLQTDYIDIYQMHNARMAQIDDDALWELLEAFKREGKIRTYGVALGPAIGWLYEGVEAVRKRNVPSLQIIWNMLEQYPGNEQIRAAYDCAADYRLHDSRPALERDARGALHRADDLSAKRPPPPSPARVARSTESKRSRSSVFSSGRIERSARPRSRGCSPSRASRQSFRTSTTPSSSRSSRRHPTHRR